MHDVRKTLFCTACALLLFSLPGAVGQAWSQEQVAAVATPSRSPSPSGWPLAAGAPALGQSGALQPATPSIEMAAPPGSTRIEPSGNPWSDPLRLSSEVDARAQARLQRLRASALASVRRGSSAEKAAAHSAWLLGLLSLHGEGVPLDRAQALHWFERAHTLGEPLASAGLAWCQIDGCQGPPNPAAARPWIAELARVDAALALLLQWWAQERLAPLQATAPARLASPPPGTDRLALLQRAAQAGNASALNELGLANMTASRLPEALGQFSLAAELSPAAASNARLLALRMQQQATNAHPAPDSADDWLAQAMRYHRGDGVPSNYTEAIRLYQIAAGQGSQAAKRMLELIYSRPSPDGTLNVAWMRQLATMKVTAEGAVLAMQAPPSPQLFVRDPTPLYVLLPPQWRTRPAIGPF